MSDRTATKVTKETKAAEAVAAEQTAEVAKGKPGIIDRLRERYSWFDHLMRTQQRYRDNLGNFYAAALSYFTVFAMFPLLMVGFSVGGFVLAARPELLDRVEDHIRTGASGKTGQQLIDLMDSAIDSRASVGIIGLAVATWAGLSWMAKLREALTQMCAQPPNRPGFVRGKLSDLRALLSTFGALVVIFGLGTLGDPKLIAHILGWLGVPDFALLGVLLRAASLVVGVLVAWSLFTWMIARLPRESVSFASSIKSGLIAAIGFEVFKKVASIYLRSVVNSPAGATFGPVLGVMVFAYVTATLILLATAWAATSADDQNSDEAATD